VTPGELLAQEVPALRLRAALGFLDPSRPDAGLTRDVAVLVRDGRVVAAGSAATPQTQDPAAIELGGEDYWLLPGLVNAHTHGRGVGWFRLGAVDDSLEPWIYALAGQPGLDPYLDTVYQNLRLLRAGVTTALHSHYPRNPADPDELEATLRAYLDTGLRVGFAVNLFTRNAFAYDDAAFLAGLPAALRGRIDRVLGGAAPPDVEGFFASVRALTRRFADDDRVRILHGPVAPQWVTDAELQRCRREADELGGGVHMHLLETPYQRAAALRAYGESWVVHLDRLGILGPRMSVAHAVWPEDDDLGRLAAAGVTVCHNPSSNLRLKSGIAPVLRMRGRGVRVALGGDNSILGGEEDFLAEMRLCASLHRQPGFEGDALEAREVLAMASVHGAVAARFDDTVGRLVPGVAGDAVLLRQARLTGPWVAPDLPPLEVLLHAGSARDVETVVVGGRVVYHAGRHRGFDPTAIEQRLRAQATDETATRGEVAALFRELERHLRSFEPFPFHDRAHYRYNAVALRRT